MSSEAESSQEEYQEELVNMASGREKPRGCCRRHPVACGVTLLVVAAVSLGVLGAALGIRSFLNQTFLDTVDKQAVLLPGTEGTKEFENSSAPLYTKFYFFNVTNPDDVVKRGAHPIVAQCGPYVYREYRVKHNLTWNANRTTVHYRLNVTYVLEHAMSSGDPTKDKIVTLNIPFYVLLMKIKSFEGGRNVVEKEFIKLVLEAFREFSGEKGLFTTLHVYDLLFGYNDPLLLFVKDFIEKVPFVKKYADQINPFFGLEVWSIAYACCTVH
jgi:lysosome membrane protein 2